MQWQEIDRIDPIGTFRVEAQLAQLTAALINLSPHASRRGVSVEDCLLEFAPRRAKSDAEIAAVFRAHAPRPRAGGDD